MRTDPNGAISESINDSLTMEKPSTERYFSSQKWEKSYKEFGELVYDIYTQNRNRYKTYSKAVQSIYNNYVFDNWTVQRALYSCRTVKKEKDSMLANIKVRKSTSTTKKK
jgi:hypothetical protein